MDAPHESYRNHQVYSEGQLLVVSYLAVSHTNPQESGFALAPQVRARRVRHTEVPHESYRNHQVYCEGQKVSGLSMVGQELSQSYRNHQVYSEFSSLWQHY